MKYRRVGRSGLLLPVVALGLWYNFGDERQLETQQHLLRVALDRGITHFDLADNYGMPPGSAEANFGRHLQTFLPSRDELVISTKAGHYAWSGPYGDGGSRKHLLSSLDRSLRRLGLDYVDIFYSHRPDPNTPLDETVGALHHAVCSGRALYVGISSYPVRETTLAAQMLVDLGTPLLVHQPIYSILNRWTEQGSPSLHQVLADLGAGCVAFSPLAQGLLTNRYVDGVPRGSRAAQDELLRGRVLNDQSVSRVHQLTRIAAEREQTLAQMAIAWVLRDQPFGQPVASALVGVSSPAQLEENLGALQNLTFSAAELAAIDRAVGVDPCPTDSTNGRSSEAVVGQRSDPIPVE